MNRTKIEWVKNPNGEQGYTWNPITGCLNGCEYCYARKLANGRLKARYLENDNIIPTAEPSWDFSKINPFYPRFWPEKIPDIRLCNDGIAARMAWKGIPLGIFTCNMSDLFGIGVPEEWTRRILDFIKSQPWHRFYLLTKQPQNLIKFSPFPDNAWVGVSATDLRSFQKARSYLWDIQARVKFISFEPLLGPIPMLGDGVSLQGINWIIIGAQTKPYKPPEIEWVKEIIEAADKADVPVFLKNNLFQLIKENYNVDTFAWAFRNGLLRQEMPL